MNDEKLLNPHMHELFLNGGKHILNSKQDLKWIINSDGLDICKNIQYPVYLADFAISEILSDIWIPVIRLHILNTTSL